VSHQAEDETVAALAAKPGVEVVRCGDVRVDMRELMQLLDTRGIKTLMVEGGSRLLHSLFEADLVSRIIIKHIPIISGALEAPSYLSADQSSSALSLSRWELTDLFMKSGVGVSVYQPRVAAA